MGELYFSPLYTIISISERKGASKMKVIRKCVGKALEIVETAEGRFMKCSKSFFDKDVTTERVYLQGYEFILVVDEEGLLKQLPVNFLMDFYNPVYPVQAIVGDVVFIRNKPIEYEGEIDDWEVTDVTDEDINRIRNLLRPERQTLLYENLKKVCEK